MNKKSLALGMILPMAAAGAVATAPAASANTYNHGHEWNRVSCRLDASTLYRVDNWRRGNDRVRLDFKLDTHSNRDRGRWVVVFKKHSWNVASSYPQRTYGGDLRVVKYVGSGPGWYSATAFNINTGQRCSDSDEARASRRPVIHPVFHGGHGPVVVVPGRPGHP